MKQVVRKKDIAVIGMSGRFPQSDDLNQFWQNLVNGKELIQFYTEDELKDKGITETILKDANYVKANSTINNSDSFDYNFFGYTKHEATSMDPQIRVLHEQVWLAMEDASYIPNKYSQPAGVFLTASDNINWRAYSLLSKNEKVNPFFLNQISNKNFISTLISYNLNLKGPSYFVDTACSSSLVGIHMACRSLWLKECSIAISGGARIESTTGIGYSFQEGMINSKDGHCRAFDKDSSGTITGEGVGVVVLKRMEDAIRDNDQIHAIIRSSSVNNDGDRKVGYTAPSVKGQSECIKRAHQIADLDSDTITYIEAHGTGTKLGDPIEIEALNRAFNYNTDHSCAIGSVKTNMGHLDTTAGVAGFIKTVLALKNKQIPPSLHYVQPNPEINFKGGPFYVNNLLKDWKPTGDVPLRAGVSSFGIGGTNAHIILEEFNQEKNTLEDNSYHLIRYSAKSVKSLEAYQNKLSDFIANSSEINLDDIAYTLQIGRGQFAYNRFLVSNKKENTVSILKSEGSEYLFSGKLEPKRNVVFMCTGSGTQYMNMCKGLYSQYPYFKQLIDNGFEQLKEITNLDFKDIIYGEKTSLINNNEYTQPIVFVYEYALAQLLIKWGISPNMMIGHSTGEYAAACLSGIFSFETGLKLVVKRAKLMSQTQKGSMLSIGVPEKEVRSLLSSGISIAAVNSPESFVVSGTETEIDELVEKLEINDIAHSKLRISLGAHSYLMDPILESYQKELEQVELLEPRIPFMSNLTGKLITNKEATSVNYWVDHLRNTVQFSKGLITMLEEPSTIFIEIGPGNALTTLFHQHSEYNTHKNSVVNLIRHPRKEINDQQFLLQKLGELWLHGIDINWDVYYEENQPAKVSVPGYSFHATRLLSRVDLLKKLSGQLENPLELLEIPEEPAPNEEDNQETVFADRSRLLTPYVAPGDKIEKTLVAIWEDFFDMEKIGVLDDFFALGGNSLKGVTMLKLIMKKFDVEINIKDFYKHASIKALAIEISVALKIRKMNRMIPSSKVVKI
ncbi:type I polyketide synthase [Aquimarina pacifica]|uniref:type I polyketide synthase n=1 Tax=Aquimarina pacifica TaxID=1296415 RepID=UPI0004713C90|nr:type I polyketide synthase [Aquimarina pacifica]